jgi:hypothetical protein
MKNDEMVKILDKLLDVAELIVAEQFPQAKTLSMQRNTNGYTYIMAYTYNADDDTGEDYLKATRVNREGEYIDK